MPGLIAFDFGDAIRIAASTGEEDEKEMFGIQDIIIGMLGI